MAQDSKWLKLGHYRKGVFGYSSAFRGNFFISDFGATSPQAELEETIKAFFSENHPKKSNYRRPIQCQFLARRKWLVEKLKIDSGDLLACEERIQWKKNLGATSVSLIFASADLGNPASSYGHTFLKFSNPANAKNKELLDYGVNFAANADESDWFYALKGLSGMYDGVFSMLPYHQKIREYINLEGRDLVEYKLTLSEYEVDELIDHLVELESSGSPYFFLTANCSMQLLELMEAIRPNLELKSQFGWWVIPIDTVKVADEAGLLGERKHKASLNSEYTEQLAKLSFLQKKALGDAIDKLMIPNDYELSSTEKAQVLETGMSYFAVRAYRSQEDLDEKKYRLSIERAQLGNVSMPAERIRDFSPERSHDSSAAYLGFGAISDRTYNSFKFRSAFHDLEQVDTGISPMSHLNVGVVELRYYQDTQKWTLAHATLLNMLNTTPVTGLDKNLSWKVRIDVLDQWRPDLEYATGYSFELPYFEKSRVAYLMTGRYLKDIGDSKIEAGPEIIFIARLNQKTAFSVDLSYLGVTQNLPYLRFFAKINYEVFRNFDLQLQADDRNDYQFNFVKNFIF